MTGILTCIQCKDVFRSRYELNNHVKRVHQTSVKITFAYGDTAIIEKGGDGKFKCRCEKRFRLPHSLQRHAKECRAETMRPSEGHENEGSVSEGGSEPMDLDEEEVDDMIDCFGTTPFLSFLKFTNYRQ